MSQTTTPKITYATLSGDGLDEVHDALDEAIECAPESFGGEHYMIVGEDLVVADEQFEDHSPIDDRILLGRFQSGTTQHVKNAVAAARRALPEWSSRPWQDRVAVMRGVAEAIREHRWELSVLLGYEVGKNRLECIGEVEESSDFVDYYCDRMEEHEGFLTPMEGSGDGQTNVSVLRPYGVFAVLSPFNFPVALTAGPVAAALITGNTVVAKPSPITPFAVWRLAEIISECDLPPGAFNFVTGSNEVVARELVVGPDVDGVVFTGSYQVGMQLMREDNNRALPRPFMAEMGGKNPALIMKSADLDKATDGVNASAFGLQGQKCSACSRVYVEGPVREAFTEMLVEKAEQGSIGNPLVKDVWLGPLISEASYERYRAAVDQAVADGGRVLTGGERLSGGAFEHGFYVQPTVIDGLPLDHDLFRTELFLPITVLGEVDGLGQALSLANGTEYGLTAGIFSEDESEIQRFFDEIEAGTIYANRRAGATAGAWPGINPFGGWKGSATTGAGAGGPHYIQQFMREQSRIQVF
ncbi:MAG TPA: aldehyde dehydrogenase family protein [Gemmatimonadetes bacterium]|nr:aldehyde dehydrogenase family protein [Gemmatimonadota bacterium]